MKVQNSAFETRSQAPPGNALLPRLCLALICFAITGCVQRSESAPPPQASTSILPKGPKLESFDLIDQDGQPFNSKSLAGKPWVASFFFTQCPAVCWRMNQGLAGWQKAHPDSEIKFVSITCDPADDTPAALKKYAEHFKADPKCWIFLTGDLKYIQRLAADMFSLPLQEETHSDRAIVVDKVGKIRGAISVTNADDYARLEKLLAEIEAEK